MHEYIEIKGNGHVVHAKIYYNDLTQVSKAVIFGTGFAGHKDNNAANGLSRKVLSLRDDVMIVVFNWPAHGDDEKEKLVLEDCGTYLKTVTDHVKTAYGILELYAYATSFGGYLMLKYVHENGDPFVKMAFRCPAVYMYDVLTGTIMKPDEVERVLKGEEVQVGFDRKVTVDLKLLNDLKEYDIRKWNYAREADHILIFHGTSDEVVPFESGREFAERNGIEFIPVEKADHRFQNRAHMELADHKTISYFGFINQQK